MGRKRDCKHMAANGDCKGVAGLMEPGCCDPRGCPCYISGTPATLPTSSVALACGLPADATADAVLARVGDMAGALDWLALHSIVEEYAEDGEAGEPEGDGEHYLVFIDVTGQRWSKRKYAKDANRDAAMRAGGKP